MCEEAIQLLLKEASCDNPRNLTVPSKGEMTMRRLHKKMDSLSRKKHALSTFPRTASDCDKRMEEIRKMTKMAEEEINPHSNESNPYNSHPIKQAKTKPVNVLNVAKVLNEDAFVPESVNQTIQLLQGHIDRWKQQKGTLVKDHRKQIEERLRKEVKGLKADWKDRLQRERTLVDQEIETLRKEIESIRKKDGLSGTLSTKSGVKSEVISDVNHIRPSTSRGVTGVVNQVNQTQPDPIQSVYKVNHEGYHHGSHDAAQAWYHLGDQLLEEVSSTNTMPFKQYNQPIAYESCPAKSNLISPTATGVLPSQRLPETPTLRNLQEEIAILKGGQQQMNEIVHGLVDKHKQLEQRTVDVHESAVRTNENELKTLQQQIDLLRGALEQKSRDDVESRNQILHGMEREFDVRDQMINILQKEVNLLRESDDNRHTQKQGEIANELQPQRGESQAVEEMIQIPYNSYIESLQNPSREDAELDSILEKVKGKGNEQMERFWRKIVKKRSGASSLHKVIESS